MTTDADHSIALNMTVLRGSVVAQRDGAARLSRRDVMHCVTL